MGLALNFSSFYYDVLGNFNQAYSIAKKAADEAFNDSDTEQSEEGCKESSVVLMLIVANVNLWRSQMQEYGT